MKYYRTRTGLFYKELSNGSKVRVSASEFRMSGGAAKKKVSAKRSKSARRSARRSASRSSRRSARRSASRSSRRSSRRAPVSDIKYTVAEQKCIDLAEEQVQKNKLDMGEGKKYPFPAAAVAEAYAEMKNMHPECADFYDREKIRKAQLKEARKALAKTNKSKRKRKRKPSKKASKKRSKSK